MDAVNKVETIVDNVGFKPLYIGELRNGVILESGSPLFGASLGLEEAKEKARTGLKEIDSE